MPHTTTADETAVRRLADELFMTTARGDGAVRAHGT
jgi:hypothetical protein